MWLRRALTCLVLATQIISAACHGMMIEPAARNVQRNSNYCPHCLAAGGPSVTQKDTRWPNTKHGVCGDPHTGPLDHEAGGKFATPPRIAATYTQGQVITIKVQVHAHHDGRFLFGVCPLSGDALKSPTAERRVVTQKCIDAHPLTNADAKTTFGGPRAFWLELQDRLDGAKDLESSAKQYTLKFKLPAGVTCERCVLQWHYESENSCGIPGGPIKKNMVPCDQTQVMEEFWNCADVRIVAGKGTPPASGKTVSPPKKAVRAKEKYTVYHGPAQLATPPRDLLAVAVVVGLTSLFMPVALAIALAVALTVWNLSAAARGRREGFARPLPLLMSVRPMFTSTEAWLRRQRQGDVFPKMEPAHEPAYRDFSRR